jgi:AcrR family transcriptional regulator
MTGAGLMKMAELSRLAGVPASTIRYYIREGMLPPPVRTGKTVAFYAQEHLERIAFIKQQATAAKPLSEIKRDLAARYPAPEREEDRDARQPHRREDIIRSAIELFLSKGYGETSIADIVNRSRMSKETFYAHFRNKEDLLIACADKIFNAMYRDVWQEIREERDMEARLKKRGKAFLASYPQWVVMMNLVRSLSLSENPVFKAKFKQVLAEIVSPVIQDIKRLKGDGLIREDLDTTLAGYIAMGMSEYGAALVHRGLCTEQEVLDSLDEVFRFGLKR